MGLYDQTYGRLFAAIYDRMLKDSEEAGLSDIRRAIVSRATGRTVEIGAGTGLNADSYSDAVTDLVLTEPFGPMAKQARERVDELGIAAEVIEAPAEKLPFENGEFDSAVGTLVLCTVDDPEATVSELARVLKPGGKLLFVEHVRSDDPKIAKRQDRWHGPWKFVGAGCNCNRDTRAILEANGFAIDDLTDGAFPGKVPSIVRPLISGSATRTA